MVPLAHRQGTFEWKARFAERVLKTIRERTAREEANGWELEEPLDFNALKREGRIEWKTAFTLNPLGDMNKAVSARIGLRKKKA
ncbi:MAG: hypothetical protein NVSMB52_08940 [Chloroflexota bacterium]